MYRNSQNGNMSEHNVSADKLKQSAKDPQYGMHDDARDCSEEDQVERSYKENYSGNAQDAVQKLMNNMDFLERKTELLYNVPKGAAQHFRTLCMRALTTRSTRLRAFDGQARSLQHVLVI